jgi:ATP-dependent DNA helicase RecQ
LSFEPKRMAPDAEGAMKKIPEGARVEDGRALARVGDPGWWPVVERGLAGGRFDDELVAASAELARAWRVPVTWVACVPSRRDGDPVRDFAGRLAAALDLPFEDVVSRAREAPPQAEMRNAAQQVANVRGAFRVASDVPSGACLLVDDRRQSGWTGAMVGGQLRGRGSGPVFPFVLASAF